MTEISGEGYKATHDEANCRVAIEGSLRLNGAAEYEPITNMLTAALDAENKLVLDLKQLEFLNSSGIASLSKFIITCRKRKDPEVSIIGSEAIAWQKKSLANLKRLMPNLGLDFE